MKENMSDKEKLELVHQMCEETNAQDVVQMLKHEDEISDIISSIEDANIKMRGIREYHGLHEAYIEKAFSDDFGISTNKRRWNIEDVLDSRFGQNIAKIAGTVDDDNIKLSLIDNFMLQISDEDKRSIIPTIKSYVKRKEAEVRFNIAPIIPAELASDEDARKAADAFDKEARGDNTKDENTIEE